MKKYIGQTLRRFLPFFIITGAILLGMALIFLGSEDSSYQYYLTTKTITHPITGEITTLVEKTNMMGAPNSGLLFLLIPVFIISALAPILANHYRFSLRSVDLFYQTGKGNKAIRYVNNLTILSMIIAIFSATYLLTMLVLVIKQAPLANQVIEEYFYEEQGVRVSYIREYVIFNYGFYVIALLLSIIFIILNYAISYFFVTRSNNLVNSMILVVFGHVALGLIIMLPFWLYNAYVQPFENSPFLYTEYYSGLKSLSPISLMIHIYKVMNPLITGGDPYKIFYVGNKHAIIDLIIAIISFVGCLGMSLLGIVKFFSEKESSGEFAGKPVGRDAFQEIIFHTGFATMAVGSALLYSGGVFAIFNVIYDIAIFLVLTAVYFALTGLLRRKFRWKLHEWFLFGGLSSINLILSVSLSRSGRARQLRRSRRRRRRSLNIL